MSTLYFVRHGLAENNIRQIHVGIRKNVKLVDAGMADIIKTGRKLSEINCNIIYTSPLERAANTAKIIAEQCGIGTIHRDGRLIERDMGDVVGMTFS